MSDVVDAEDWGGRRIENETFADVRFLEADLSEVVTVGAVFDGCTFQGVRFNGSRHQSSAFVNCRFVRCSFWDVTFSGCKLVGTTFDRCQLNLLKVEGGDWSLASLATADLTSARFEDVRLREADLGHVKGLGTTLVRVDLSGAVLEGADLREADLRGSDLSSLDPTLTKVKDAIVTFDQAVNVARGFGFDVRAD